MTAETCESINDLISRCTSLALDLAYSETDPKGHYFTPREGMGDDVWGWADGLCQQRLYNLRDGRCSLQATVDFDIEKEEETIRKTIARFERLLEKVGRPTKLTPKEMVRRGYKGY